MACKFLLMFAVLLAVVQGFVLPSARTLNSITTKSQTSTGISKASRAVGSVLNMAAPKGAKDEVAFWEGEWVCADCGYIYDRDDCGGLYFEQQKRGFVCPQCRGPRRRFAKKVGDKVGITQDGGDAAILLFSFLGFAGTVAFGFWFANQ